MKCENCGKEIDSVQLDIFNYDGSDSFYELPISEEDEDAVVIDTTANWCGYGLSDEERAENIRCPYCKKFPFHGNEVQEYEILRLVCFKKEEE